MKKANIQSNYQVREISDHWHPVIECQIRDSSSEASFRFALSDHAAGRCAERRISAETLALALLCSRPVYKQGVIFHVVSLRLIPAELSQKQKRCLQDLVVITDRSVSCVITAYYCTQAFRKTSKKLKFNCKAPGRGNAVAVS